MKVQLLILCFFASLVTEGAFGATVQTEIAFPVIYEGGNLPLSPHLNAKVILTKDDVVITQRKERFVIPVRDITEISCGSEIHRRGIPAIGAIPLGIGPRVGRRTEEDHYIAVTWTGRAKGGKISPIEMVLKLGKGEYREFLSALEAFTGRKAVNTDVVGAVVHYAL